jgi:hypothetical protein
MIIRFLPDATITVIDGLLLQPTSGRAINGSKKNCKGEFTRIGRFFRNGHDKWSKLVQGEPLIIDPELEFEKDNKDGTYTIRRVAARDALARAGITIFPEEHQNSWCCLHVNKAINIQFNA